MTHALTSARDGAVLTVTLRRPERLNSITLAMIDEFDAILDTVSTTGVRALVVTGEGRAFCAGFDVSQLPPGTETLGALERLSSLLVRISELPVPVIAKVNGIAMGAGAELILAADFAIASDTAEIGDGHLNIGAIPGGGGATILARRLPEPVAKYLLFTGRRLSARDAKTHGLVAEVVSADELDGAVSEIVADVAAKSPLGVAMVKQLVAQSRGDRDAATSLRREAEANHRYVDSEDLAEGMAAFREKRTPRFVGR